MASNAMGFLQGLQGGMNMTFGLLDTLENRQRREQQAKRQALLFQQQQADRQWEIENRRPLLLKDLQLSIQDKQGQVDYNRQYRPMALESTRLGLEGKQDDLNYNRQLRPLLLQDKQGQVDYNRQYRPMALESQRVGLLSSIDTLEHNRAVRPYQLRRLGDEEQYRREDRGYLTNVVRPFELEKQGRTRSDWEWQDQERGRQQHNWQYEDTYVRPQQKKLDDWNLKVAQQRELRAQQKANLERGGQLAAMAFHLADIDPKQADRYYQQAEKLLGGQLENAVHGMYSYTMALAQEVQNGQRDPDDPEYQEAIRQVVMPTMKVTGRDQGYEFVGLDQLDDGRIVPLMQPKTLPKIVDQMIKVESAGQATAKNPRSTATGLGQFTEGTWLATMKKHNPGLMKGKSRAQVLALRNDPKVSWQMTEAYARDNQDYLRSKGIRVNATTTYLAHHFGSGGAVRLLNSDPDTPVSKVLSQQELNANPQYKGMSVGQLVGRIKDKMTVPATEYMTGDPRDRVQAISQERAMQILQQGVALERQIPKNLKQRAKAVALGAGTLSAGNGKGQDAPKLPMGYQWVDPADYSKGAMRIPGTDKGGSGSSDDPNFYEKEQFKALIKKRDLLLEGLNNPMLENSERQQLQQEAAALDQQINQLAGGGQTTPASTQGEQVAAVNRLREIAASVPDAELPAFVATMRRRGATDEQIQALVGERLAKLQQGKKPVSKKKSPFSDLGAPTTDDFMTLIQ